MKLLISFLFSIFILFSNLSASENTQKLTPKINNEQLQELIKKLPRENSFTQNTSNEDWFKKLRPFIVPLALFLTDKIFLTSSALWIYSLLFSISISTL